MRKNIRKLARRAPKISTTTPLSRRSRNPVSFKSSRNPSRRYLRTSRGVHVEILDLCRYDQLSVDGGEDKPRSRARAGRMGGDDRIAHAAVGGARQRLLGQTRV